MFPTATIKAPGVPESRMSLDDYISNMNIEKDNIGPLPGADPRPPVPMPGVAKVLSPEEEAKFSADTAAAAGEQLAALVDNGSRALCGIIGSNKEDKYRMSAGQRRDLTDSYGRLAQHYGFSGANPLLEAVLLTLIILAPKFKEAFADRKIKKMEEEQQRQADEQVRIANRQTNIEAELNMLKAKAEIKDKAAKDGTETQTGN